VRGQTVDPSSPSTVSGPFAGQQGGPLQSVERRVDRAFGQVERAPAYSAELRHDGVPVRRLPANGGQQKEGEVALQQLRTNAAALHTLCHHTMQREVNAERAESSVN